MLEAAAAQGKITIVQPSPEDIAKVMAITKAKIGDDWVDKMNKRGLPGQKVLDRWVELLAKWHGTRAF